MLSSPSATKPVTFIVWSFSSFTWWHVVTKILRLVRDSSQHYLTWFQILCALFIELILDLYTHYTFYSTYVYLELGKFITRGGFTCQWSVVRSDVCVGLVTIRGPSWLWLAGDGRGRGDPGDQAVWNMQTRNRENEQKKESIVKDV